MEEQSVLNYVVGAFRIIVLRGALDWPEERGIHAIISLPVVLP